MSDSNANAPQAKNPDAGARAVFKYDGSRMADIDPDTISAHRFPGPGHLNQADLQQLDELHRKFVQHVSARLSTFLRMECTLRIARFASVPFNEFSSSINDPSHVTLFQAEPLGGIGILDLGVQLGLAIADRILGGRGRAEGMGRSLTEIELALVEDAVTLVLDEWSKLWETGEKHPPRNASAPKQAGAFCKPPRLAQPQS